VRYQTAVDEDSLAISNRVVFDVRFNAACQTEAPLPPSTIERSNTDLDFIPAAFGQNGEKLTWISSQRSRRLRRFVGIEGGRRRRHLGLPKQYHGRR
jgi:hypothetical protein